MIFRTVEAEHRAQTVIYSVNYRNNVDYKIERRLSNSTSILLLTYRGHNDCSAGHPVRHNVHVAVVAAPHVSRLGKHASVREER